MQDVENVKSQLEDIQAADAVAAAEKAFNEDMDAESLRTINVPALIDAVNHLVDCSEQRVIECLLSSDVHAGNILKLLSQPINLYLTSARELLNHYLGTEDKFSQVPGQENKILLLKLRFYYLQI